MGFVKGANVEVEKVAPLGDPIQVKVKGYSVCLRKEEAKNKHKQKVIISIMAMKLK